MMQENNTAIVTGASSGIGLALAQALHAQGFNVIANSRAIMAAGVLKPGPGMTLVEGDVAVPETATRLVETAVESFGGLDLLVNNAGIFIPKPFVEYTAADFNSLVSTNLTGFFFLTQQAVRRMRGQKAGHVVTITTSLADQPVSGMNAAVPILTKGGLNAVTKALAIEFAGDGIRFNAVSPGIIDTPMHKPEAHGFLKQLHPIARLGTTQEIIDAVVYLNHAKFVTGEVLHVDGGAHAGKW